MIVKQEKKKPQMEMCKLVFLCYYGKKHFKYYLSHLFLRRFSYTFSESMVVSSEVTNTQEWSQVSKFPGFQAWVEGPLWFPLNEDGIKEQWGSYVKIYSDH